MSTRANVVIRENDRYLIFYRHSDGYPEVTGESLKTFMNWLKEGKIRKSLSQASGWLIILGNTEYEVGNTPDNDWKVGAYEPTTNIHGDIEYLYLIDINKARLYVTHEIERIGVPFYQLTGATNHWDEISY